MHQILGHIVSPTERIIPCKSTTAYTALSRLTKQIAISENQFFVMSTIVYAR